MYRYSMPFRLQRKVRANAERRLCRMFINGSCRYGPSCTFLHEFPSVPSFQVECRYFQKGDCWFGDSCRYLHIPQVVEGSSGSTRRGSSPAVFPSAAEGRSLADRRGSEPTLHLAHRGYNVNRRASEPLVSSMDTLYSNFEHFTSGIAEEDEFAGVEDAPLQHGAARTLHQRITTDSSSLHSNTHTAVVPGATAVPKATAYKPKPKGGAIVSTVKQLSGSRDQSKEVACGICMDQISEKSTDQDRRYGILPNCNHAFCIGCIVTWRKTKEFQEDVIKACPQCRVKSSFYVPSKHWVCEGEEKDTLIASFKERSSKLICKFFMRDGCCPFKSECIYSHDVTPNHTPRRRPSLNRGNAERVEDIDGLQILSYIFALTLLDEDDDDSEILDFF